MGLSTSNLTTINPQISVQIPSKPNSPDRILGIEKAQKMAYFRAFLAFLSCRLSLGELQGLGAVPAKHPVIPSLST